MGAESGERAGEVESAVHICKTSGIEKHALRTEFLGYARVAHTYLPGRQ